MKPTQFPFRFSITVLKPNPSKVMILKLPNSQLGFVVDQSDTEELVILKVAVNETSFREQYHADAACFAALPVPDISVEIVGLLDAEALLLV